MTNKAESNPFFVSHLENVWGSQFLPVSPVYSESSFTNWESSRFNNEVLKLYEVVTAEPTSSFEKSQKLIALAEMVRTYWGTILRRYTKSLKEGTADDTVDVRFEINKPSYAPDDRFHFLPIYRLGRNFLSVKRSTGGEDDVLTIDNPDVNDYYQFSLRSTVHPYEDSNVITQYEMQMLIPSGIGDIKDFSILKSEYCAVTSAPDFWEKVRAYKLN